MTIDDSFDVLFSIEEGNGGSVGGVDAAWSSLVRLLLILDCAAEFVTVVALDSPFFPKIPNLDESVCECTLVESDGFDSVFREAL